MKEPPLKIQYHKTYVEDIIFERQNQFYERAQRVSTILFLTRENKIPIFKPPCNFLFIIGIKVNLSKT